MMRVELSGTAELKRTLERLGVDAEKELTAAVQLTAFGIRTNAQNAIARGTKSGRVYTKSDPDRTHRASGPGEAPATDQGGLIRSLRADVSGKTASVIADTEYAAALEFGTSRIKQRPFMIPAMEHERPKWERRLRDAVKKAKARSARR